MQGNNTQEHIKGFLRENPGHLHVVVGYASVWGLAWLQDHTQGRPVSLIVGDAKAHHFEKATDADRRRALAFIGRRDVRVLNWYRTARSAQGKSMLHAKAWIATDRSGRRATAALVGSANLTKVGLQDNWEMMAVVAEAELPRIWEQLDGFIKGRTVKNKPWDAKSKLKQAIEEGRRPKTRPSRLTSEPATKKKSGCLVLTAAIGATTAALITTILLLLL